MKVYISGPITIDPDNWKKHFADAEEFIREKYPKADIVNPLSLDEDPELVEAREVITDSKELWKFIMKRDISLLMQCSHIYCLKGWENSPGAKIELRTAVDVGIKPLFEE